MDINKIPFYQYNTIIVGTGAAGLNAAVTLHKLGQKNIALITEGRYMVLMYDIDSYLAAVSRGMDGNRLAVPVNRAFIQ